MSSSSLSHYTSSGKFGITTFAYWAAAVVAMSLLAFIYTLGLNWIPFIYIEFILVGGFGFAIAMAGVLAIDMGKCRNAPIAALLGLVLGATALFASFWWGYRSALSSVLENNPGIDVEMVRAQYTLAAFIDDRVEGGWKLKNSTLNGAFVYVMWAIEAAILLGFPVVMMWSRAKESFCEKCNAWHGSEAGATPGLKATDVKPLIDSGDLAQLFALPEQEVQLAEGSKIVFERFFCASCHEQSFLTIKETTWSTNKKGGIDEKTSNVAELIELSPELTNQFTARFMAPQRGPELSPA